MHESQSGTYLAGAVIAALVLASCTQPPPSVPRPEPPPPAASPAPMPERAPGTSQALPRDAARDSARLRALDGVGIPPAGARRACELAGRVRLDADSVGLRFTAGFMKVGILPIRLSLPSVDGVAAGPADVDTPAPSRISARARTVMRGDSTAYRVEVLVAPPRQGWTAGDSAAATAYAAGLCTRVEGLAFPTG